MHGIAAITGNMHCSLRYFVLFIEHITSRYAMIVHLLIIGCNDSTFINYRYAMIVHLLIIGMQ